MFGFLKKPIADLFIARPESATQQIVFRWPDQSIPNGAKLTVRADECALFFKQGALVGQLEAGAHVIDSAHMPFLGDLIVSPLTNDNHYITEVFFIRRTEHPYALGPVKLGTFQDLASRLMVTLGFSAQFTVRVTSPEKLMTRLVGMSSDVMGALGQFLEGRVRSMLQQAVGRQAAAEPILQIASNQYNEELGQAVIERTRAEFANDGIEVTRFLALDLQLDASSEAQLRQFGGKLADLSVQREQADVGNQAGFAAYNLVKGQADLMRGVATGAAVHGLPALAPLGGVGLGGPMLAAAIAPTSSHGSSQHTPAAPAPRLAGGASTKYYLRGPGGVEGPYPPRQVALRAASLKLQADTVFVRAPGATDWEIGADIPDIARELEKRLAHAPVSSPTAAGVVPSPTDAFERALTVAVADKVLTVDELDLLSMLAVGANLAKDDESARQYVTIRARALGCDVQTSAPAPEPVPDAAPPSMPQPPPLSASAPGGPPPLRLGTVYVYDNGMQRTEGLSAKAVATRVKAAPDGVHMVWWNGAADWSSADEVEAIRSELAKLG
ncbi:MAG: SPFH domain-containing protein [Deltaproteobacteria bacterium]|nr:SPFH domain-containing protein [Deltaproteobacteria bacterium]